MNISPDDIATLEKLTGQDGARGALARVMLAILDELNSENDTELLEE